LNFTSYIDLYLRHTNVVEQSANTCMLIHSYVACIVDAERF